MQHCRYRFPKTEPEDSTILSSLNGMKSYLIVRAEKNPVCYTLVGCSANFLLVASSNVYLSYIDINKISSKVSTQDVLWYLFYITDK